MIMTFYNKYIDCAKLFSDFYENTPHVSAERNGRPAVIHLRWDSSLDPSTAVVEFYNYYSILPHQHAKTITDRSTFGIYPATSPDLSVPLSSTIVVPPFAQRFRIRIDKQKPFVTKFVPVSNNDIYYYEGGNLYQLYSM